MTLALTLNACVGRSSMTASGWASVVVDENSAYVAFNSHVVSVNLTNGTERWRFPAEADPKMSFFASPGLTENNKLIVGGYDNVLYSINTDNGQGTPFFEKADGRYIGGPLVTSEMIYAPSADHSLYAIGLNGNQAWSFETDEPLWSKATVDSECGCLFVSSMDHKIYALDAQTGGLIWTTEDLGGAIVGTPQYSDDDVLYVGTFNKELIALDATTGRDLWRFQTNDWVWATPALDDNTLYFGDLSGTFYAVNRQNGVSQWQIQLVGAIVGTPLVTKDGIYFTTEDGSLVSVNSSGAIRWNQPLDTSLHAGPVAAGETILIATSNPESLLIAVDPSGVQIWSFNLDQE